MPGNGAELLEIQIIAFLNFCRLEKGLSANTLECYGGPATIRQLRGNTVGI